MKYKLSEDELKNFTNEFFIERGGRPFEMLDKTLLLLCVRDPNSTMDLKNQNCSLKVLVDEFENWLKPKIRNLKIANLAEL